MDTESYTNGGPHNLTITWTELETLTAGVVEFGELQLVPNRYEERLNEDGSIAISLQATLTAEETEILRSIPRDSEDQYRPTIRRGVSDEIRSMRLGRVLWQRLEGGGIGHDVTLVDRAFDSSESSAPILALAGEPQVGNLIDQVSALLARFDALVDELEIASVLMPEAVKRIRQSAASASLRRHEFFEVGDLAKW